jgi:hypothetical protein
VLVHGGNRPRSHGVACVHQQFQPFAEALHVETLVLAWLSAPPQIEIEDRRQLCWGRRGDNLCTDIVSAIPDELMQGLWRELRHDSHDLWHIHRACQRSQAPPATSAFWHELTMIRVPPLNKQSRTAQAFDVQLRWQVPPTAFLAPPHHCDALGLGLFELHGDEVGCARSIAGRDPTERFDHQPPVRD